MSIETHPLLADDKSIVANEAVNGYLKNRHLLCEQLSKITSTYEREKDRRKCIENQIDIIDKCVTELIREIHRAPRSWQG